MEIENPPSDSSQSNGNFNGSSEIENPQFSKTLEKQTQDRGQIENTQLNFPTDKANSKVGVAENSEKHRSCDLSCIDIDLKCNEGEIESSPFSHESWNEPKPCPVGAGLANLGNTCFLNAIIQCFTHTVPLVQGLQSYKHDPSIHGDCEFCVLCAVREQIEHSFAYTGRVVSPYKLVDNLSYISSFFRRYWQEDAHEFLQCLLDKLDSNWSKYEATANDSSSSDDSIVKQVFGGRLVSQLHCGKCGHNSYTYEPLIDLSLGIEDANNLEHALMSFTKEESIEETEKFTCESCKEQVTGKKQLMLDKAPLVAALHLKRFNSNGEKINTMIEYPLELDLKPYMKGSIDENEELKYELYGVVMHVGFSSTSGHYFCYIRTAPDTWYRFDDSKVSRVLETTALSQDAYILFYVRKGTPWFSRLFDEWRVNSEKKIFNTSPKSVLDGTYLPSESKSFAASFHSYDSVRKNNAIRDTFNEPSVAVRNDIQSPIEVGTCASAATNITSPSSSGMCPGEAKMDYVGFDGLKPVAANDSYSQLSTEQRRVEVIVAEHDKGETGNISHDACFSSRVESIIGSEAKRDVCINPSTPTRSPSPDIYSDDEPAEEAFRIPLNHLITEDKASSAKKSMEKAKHDIKRKEAAKYMSKSMPVGRRQMLMAAMMNGSSSSDGPLNKKRKQALSLQNKQSESQSQSQRKKVKLSPKRVLRPVAA